MKSDINTIITQAYHISRYSSCKLSSKARIAWALIILYASSKVKNKNDAIRNRISDFDKRRISQPRIQ